MGAVSVYRIVMHDRRQIIGWRGGFHKRARIRTMFKNRSVREKGSVGYKYNIGGRLIELGAVGHSQSAAFGKNKIQHNDIQRARSNHIQRGGASLHMCHHCAHPFQMTGPNLAEAKVALNDQDMRVFYWSQLNWLTRQCDLH